MVGETSQTLLSVLRDGSDDQRWSELVELYTPFIQSIVIACGVKGADTDDIVQNVLTVVFQRVSDFDRKRIGSFRAWLRSITVNSLRESWRSKQAKGFGIDSDVTIIDQLEDPNSATSQHWDQEHNRHVLAYLMKRAKVEFRTSTWQAFHLLAMENKSVDEVAEQLSMTPNAAFIARSRVMKRLREIGAEILE